MPQADRNRLKDSATGSAPALDAALRALADGNRRRILTLVRDQAGAVGEIAERVSMSQQAVSHHLRVLRGAGLVTEQRQGTRHLFRVRTDGLRVVEEFVDGFWPAHLAALKRAAEAEFRRGGAGGNRDG
jgi:DNA-binding transcriptional ArsR family regulator